MSRKFRPQSNFRANPLLAVAKIQQKCFVAGKLAMGAEMAIDFQLERGGEGCPGTYFESDSYWIGKDSVKGNISQELRWGLPYIN